MSERMKATPEELEVARKRVGPIEQREKRLAYAMLAPTIAIVLLIVLFPVAFNFWISFKPVQLADLRPATANLNERVRGNIEKAGDTVTVRYRARSTSQSDAVSEVVLTDTLPSGLEVVSKPENCEVSDGLISCDVGTLEPRKRQQFEFEFAATQAYIDAGMPDLKDSSPSATGSSRNVLTNLQFTFKNFARVFTSGDFGTVLWVSFVYTVGGTLGALVLGLLAAQLLDTVFPGRALLRGLFLFPYVSPVIAVAFTWLIFLDANSGVVNALLRATGALGSENESINFLGTEGLALATVIVFESWRYFPLAFLFILARMQSLSSDLYEAAEMDGATPFQMFRFISLPQLFGIMATLFLLRFIWTFNKFDDIFLLTGGASGTETFTVSVYKYSFGSTVPDLGAAAAVAVIIFFVLAIFVSAFFAFGPKEEGM